MAKVYRFRVTSTVGTDRLAVGPKEYAAGQEFTLSSDQVKKFINTKMIDDGYLVPVEELGGDAPQAWSTAASDIVEGKSGQILDRFGETLDLETRYVGLQVVLAADDVVDQTDEARFWPVEDCYFESVQIVDATRTLLAAGNYRLQIKNIPNGTSTATAVDMLEYDGTGNIKASHAAVGASGSTPTNLTIAANGPAASGTFDLSLAASNVEWAYFGLYDKFDGLWFDINTVNAAEATATFEYSKVTASGTIDWTTFPTFTDGTVSSNKSFGVHGAVTWDRPGDWGKTSIGSEASGAASLYYMRVCNASANALTTEAKANEVWLLSRHMRPKDNNIYIAKGDMLRIDSPLGATGVFTGSNYTGAIDIVMALRKAR